MTTYDVLMDTNGMTLRQLVLDRINELSLKPAQYATRIGVTRAQLHQITTGETVLPQDATRRKLAADLGISVLDFFLMAGEIVASDIPGRTSPAVTRSRADSLCHQLHKIDWELVTQEGKRYEHLVEDLELLAERYPAQPETQPRATPLTAPDN